MKLNDIKHNHSLTDLLKILIFSILMLVPFLSVATRSLYVISNKNAYESYSNKNIIEKTTLVASTGNLETDLLYELKLDLTIGQTDSNRIFYKQISIDWTDYGAPTGQTYNGFSMYKTTGSNYYIYLRDVNDNILYTFWNGLDTFGSNLQFSFVSDRNQTQNGNQCYRIYTNTFQQQQLDNVFEYSIDQLAESQYYNWTQNTTIYTGIETMTTQLGITGATIPILLTYWFMLTIIYVVIDIILKIFTVLTHMLGNKTAK